MAKWILVLKGSRDVIDSAHRRLGDKHKDMVVMSKAAEGSKDFTLTVVADSGIITDIEKYYTSGEKSARGITIVSRRRQLQEQPAPAITPATARKPRQPAAPQPAA